MDVIWIDKDDMQTTIKELIWDVDIVLDIGCGIRPQELVDPRVHILVEPHYEYVQYLMKELQGDSKFVFLQCTWQQVVNLLPDKSVNSIFLLDIIEHVRKDLALQLLNRCEKIATDQIVVFTPLGFYPQVYIDGQKDRWDMHGGKWQEHKSAWQPSDFGDPWIVIAVKAFHFDDGYGNSFDPPIGAIWAIRNLNTSAKRDDNGNLNRFFRSISGFLWRYRNQGRS